MKIWVHIDGRQLGPYAPEQLPLDEMDATTPVWYDGLPHWTPAGEAPATAPYFLPGAHEPKPTSAPSPAAEVEAAIEPVDEVVIEVEEAPTDETDEQEYEGDESDEDEDDEDNAPLTAQMPQAPVRPRAQLQAQTEPCPPTYLIWSILLTLCCCNPLGIIPIITGAQVSSRYNNMDFEGARRASVTTEWWVMICLVLGLMMLPFNILIYL